MLAFLLDEALATRLRVEELNATMPRSKLPADTRYATEADVEDWAAGGDDD